MSLILRIEMIVTALVVMFIIIHSVNRRRLRIQYSFFWLLIVAAMLVAAFFPGVVTWLCQIMDIEKPSNLVYLCGILSLMLITFYQTILLSKQADRITHLTQIVSIQKFLSGELQENAGKMEGEGPGRAERKDADE